MFQPPTGYLPNMSESEPPEFAATDESAVPVLQEFADAGWSINHIVRSDGDVECGECGESSSADRWTVEAQHRIEGASDPDDLQLVAGMLCPECEAKGSIIIGYGPNASDNDGDVLLGLDLDDVSDPIAST